MRIAQLALIVPLLAGPATALAAPWNGVTPGTTTQAQVEQRFGEPTKRTKSGARAVLGYFGDQAMEGTKQVQFHLDDAGRVQEIAVFLTVPLDPETIEGKYGKPSQKTFVDATFQKVWIYAAQGVTVYWAKDGSGAEALSFSPAKAGAARPEQARPGGAKAEGDAPKPAAAEAPKPKAD
ncbi:MAG TPA: hypothetical protein VEB43_00705 [Anaeromyxobacter sp.]|nr:hypothetical protein [Anaeromyxobacter sp.]